MSSEKPTSPSNASDRDTEHHNSLPPQHVFDDDIEMRSNLAKQPPNFSQPPLQTHVSEHQSDIHPVQKPQNHSHHNLQLSNTTHPADSKHQTQQTRNTEHPLTTVTTHQTTLFQKLLTKPASAPGLVNVWMSHVSNNGPEAMAAIISLVFSAARPIPLASDDVITPLTIITNDPPSSVKEKCKLMAEDAPDKVIVLAKDSTSRRVRRAYDDFWRRVAAEASDVLLYGTDCFETLIPWLDAISSAPIRALRMSACIAAYRLVDGFIEVSMELRKQLATMQRQLNTEKRKSGISVNENATSPKAKRDSHGKGKKKPLSAKGKELANKVDELTAKSSELTELSDRIYRTMFICRYRDVSGDVRSLSVCALGGWIVSFPDQFLDDTHNKYIGWLLSDKDANVRKASLDILQRLLKRKEFFTSFETFLQRFCDRAIEMAWDKDDAVAVSAIRLLTFLLPHNVDNRLVRASNCEAICSIAIEDSNTDIRRAAGEFLATLVTMDANDSRTPSSKRKRATRKRNGRQSAAGPFNTLLREIPPHDRAQDDIKELLYAVVGRGQDSLNPSLAVDAVWDFLPALRSWQAFETLLLEDSARELPGDDEDGLSEEEKGVLCKIFLATVIESSGGGDPNRAKAVENGEYAEPDTPGLLLTKHFLPLMPKLLSQYQSDPNALCALVQLPRYFEVAAYEQQRQKSHFSAMLERILATLLRHTGSDEVTSACAGTLRFLLSERNPLKKTTCTALQLSCQKVVKDLSIQVRTDLAEAAPDTIAALVSQVRILTELVDTDSSTYETIKEVLLFQGKKDVTSGLNDLVTIDAARAACAVAVWSLARTKSRLSASGISGVSVQNILELEEVEENRKHVIDVIDDMQMLCESTSMSIQVQMAGISRILIILTLCRGIEKNVSLMISKEQSGKDASAVAPTDLNFFGLSDKVDSLVAAVKSVMYGLIDYDLARHDPSASKQSRPASAVVERDMRDFFACLVQASLQSVLSRQISHLPLLGVLLSEKKSENDVGKPEYTSARVCRDYLQQRQIRGSSLTADTVKIFDEVNKLQCSPEVQERLIRELAELCTSFRNRRDLREKASLELLQALIDCTCSAKNSSGFRQRLITFSAASFAVVPHLSVADALTVQELVKQVSGLIANHTESLEEEVVKTFEICRSSIEAVAAEKHPDIPPIPKIYVPPGARKGLTSRRKRRPRHPKLRTPPPEPANVRKSSRIRKKVDYTRLGDLKSDEGEEEQSDSEEEEQEVVLSPARRTVAEVARNMMEYQNSPVAGRKRPTKPSAGFASNHIKRVKRKSGSSESMKRRNEEKGDMNEDYTTSSKQDMHDSNTSEEKNPRNLDAQKPGRKIKNSVDRSAKGVSSGLSGDNTSKDQSCTEKSDSRHAGATHKQAAGPGERVDVEDSVSIEPQYLHQSEEDGKFDEKASEDMEGIGSSDSQEVPDSNLSMEYGPEDNSGKGKLLLPHRVQPRRKNVRNEEAQDKANERSKIPDTRDTRKSRRTSDHPAQRLSDTVQTRRSTKTRRSNIPEGRIKKNNIIQAPDRSLGKGKENIGKTPSKVKEKESAGSGNGVIRRRKQRRW